MKPGEAAQWLAAARWRPGRGVTSLELQTLLLAARAALAVGPEPRKLERHKAIFELPLEGAASAVLLKIERHERASIFRRLGAGPAVSQLRLAETLAARGIATPVPLAAGSCRRRGLLEASLLLVPIVPGATDLAAFGDDGRITRAGRRAAIRELGVLARQMHDAGVDQDDFAPNNFLWRKQPAPHLLAIDFERTRIGGSLRRGTRARQLAKLDRHGNGASAPDRFRLLRAYAGGDARAARAWWQAVADAHGALARRDFRHLLRTGTRASRRFVPVSWLGGSGWARRDAPLAMLLPALTAPATAEFPDHWVQWLGALDARAAARTWAAALTLAQRGCAPEPLALLCRGGSAALVYERTTGSQRLGDADLGVARGALIGLLGRLLSFGFEPSALPASALWLVPGSRGGWRALSLDPRGLRPGHASPGTTIAARAWAARLLGPRDTDCDPPTGAGSGDRSKPPG